MSPDSAPPLLCGFHTPPAHLCVPLVAFLALLAHFVPNDTTRGRPEYMAEAESQLPAAPSATQQPTPVFPRTTGGTENVSQASHRTPEQPRVQRTRDLESENGFPRRA